MKPKTETMLHYTESTIGYVFGYWFKFRWSRITIITINIINS